MIAIRWFEGLLVQKIPILIVVIPLTMGILLVQGLSLLFLLKNSFPGILLSSAFFKADYADHGQEITITLHNSSFGSLSSGSGNQIIVFATYELTTQLQVRQ
jgi:hypothetical protein